MTPAIEHLVRLAEAEGATIVRSPGATIIVLPAATAADPDRLLPIAEAATVAATSMRVVQDAVRSGVLPAYGGQRDRSVRRGDLERWVTDRRTPVAAVERDQIARVERRLGRRGSR